MAADRRLRTLRRLFRLWRIYAYLDLLWITRDRWFCLTCCLADAVESVASVSATLLLASRFEGIGRWSLWQVVFMLGYGTVVSGVITAFFQYNVLHISRRLGRGQLDHILIQPQPIWMALLTEGFVPFSSSAILLPGLGLMAWAVARLSLAVSLGWLSLAALNLAASSIVVLSFSFLWGSLAFWAPRAAEEISSSAVDLTQHLKVFPLDGLAWPLQGGLLTAVPVGLVAWFPCRALLGLDQRSWTALATPLASMLLALVAMWVFRRGRVHYGRTGSQRYSSWGHRS